MRILITGKGGNAGSWKIRGEQIGAALGATVAPMATVEQCRAHDVIVVVKRCPPQLLDAVRRSGRPWAYDIVDAYPQPESSAWGRPQAVQWVRDTLALLRPDGVIWPTRAMCDDLGGNPSAVVYHHARPRAPVNPLRPVIQTIGYEGSAAYLDGWHNAIEKHCRARGWRFVVNPPYLADLDVVLALRGGPHDGYVSRHWKSNVKLANAHATGTPFIGLRESGYLETAVGGEVFIDRPADLAGALGTLESYQLRIDVAAAFRPAAYTIEAAAERLRGALCALRS